ncbi:alpha/beta hydrolase fold domain-containing protein [uncultured Nocardioides sp.]|uniref:alpha/beta hydrolase fold domain-containing protein n=1 Tax=uncultured Nocardioides sp. TaxID=198441 RepID=UPI000C4261EC|nr:alpha/beta hydrolase fold domain-containing protein [uncultured Nocardioides sp.]MAO79461.1 esterase [Nocardioides sp.]
MLSWDVDDRKRHPWTVAYMKGMWARRDKEAFEGADHTICQAQELQRDGDAPPDRWTRLHSRVSAERRDQMLVWRVRPRGRRPEARVVYVHGGGYVHPLTPDYWRLVRALGRVPAEVVVPVYPLAPDATADDVLPRLLELVDDGRDLPTVLMGDSAGGALVLVLARLARDRGIPVAGVVALSPWLDATLQVREDEVQSLEVTDPMLAETGLRAAGRAWSGERSVEDPLISPVHLDLDGLPPIDLFIGDRDILRPAVDELAQRGGDADVEMCVHEVTSMFHVWMTRAIPEGWRTRQRLVETVRARAD